MCSALLESEHKLLGYNKSRQPDWFQESVDELRPQLQRRNNAYDRWLASGKEERWLASGKEEDLTRFKVARNEAREAIREARIAGSDPRQRRQKESVLGGRRCGSA